MVGRGREDNSTLQILSHSGRSASRILDSQRDNCSSVANIIDVVGPISNPKDADDDDADDVLVMTLILSYSSSRCCLSFSALDLEVKVVRTRMVVMHRVTITTAVRE